jgi:hypothetical protein
MARSDVEQLVVDDSPVVIGATGMESVRQCIRTIVRTLMYSVPLDRGFANAGEMIDSPAPARTAQLASEIIDAVERYEPRVRVKSVTFKKISAASHMEGVVCPVVSFSIDEEAQL